MTKRSWGRIFGVVLSALLIVAIAQAAPTPPTTGGLGGRPTVIRPTFRVEPQTVFFCNLADREQTVTLYNASAAACPWEVLNPFGAWINASPEKGTCLARKNDSFKLSINWDGVGPNAVKVAVTDALRKFLEAQFGVTLAAGQGVSMATGLVGVSPSIGGPAMTIVHVVAFKLTK